MAEDFSSSQPPAYNPADDAELLEPAEPVLDNSTARVKSTSAGTDASFRTEGNKHILDIDTPLEFDGPGDATAPGGSPTRSHTPAPSRQRRPTPLNPRGGNANPAAPIAPTNPEPNTTEPEDVPESKQGVYEKLEKQKNEGGRNTETGNTPASTSNTDAPTDPDNNSDRQADAIEPGQPDTDSADALGNTMETRPYAPTAPLLPDTNAPAITPADRAGSESEEGVDIGKSTPPTVDPNEQSNAATSLAQSQQAKNNQPAQRRRRPEPLNALKRGLNNRAAPIARLLNRKKIAELTKKKKAVKRQLKDNEYKADHLRHKIIFKAVRIVPEAASGIGIGAAIVEAIRLYKNNKDLRKARAEVAKDKSEIKQIDENIEKLNKLFNIEQKKQNTPPKQTTAPGA